MTFRISTPSAIGIISGALAMLSLLLVWVTASPATGFFEVTGTDVTGWEIFYARGSESFSAAYVIPAAVWGIGFSLIALSFLGCLSIYSGLDKRMLSIPMFMIGLTLIVMYVLFFNEYLSKAESIGVTLEVGTGLYLLLLAGIGGIVAGALRQATQIREM